MFFNFKIVCCFNLFLLLLLQQTTSSSKNVREIAAKIRELSYDQPAQACQRFAALDSSLKQNPYICKPATIALSKIISKFNQRQQFNEAINVYQQGIKDGIPKDTITDNAVIKSYCQKGDTNEARKIFETMDGKDTITLNTMISGYTDNQQFDRAIQLYEHGYRIAKNTITNTAVIKAYCEAGKTDKARQVFDSMREKNTFTLSTMISGYTDNKQFEKAIQMYEHGYGIAKDTITNTAAIKAYCGAGKTDKAKKVFDSMREKNTITLNTMITGYTDNKEFEKAIQLYEHGYGIPNDKITHNAAIKAYCGAGITDKARQIFNCMKEKNTITLNTMISGYIDNQQFDKAIQLYNDPAYRIPKDTTTHNAAIKRHCEFQNTIKAPLIFDSMTCKDTYTLNTMIKGYINNEQLMEAIQLYEQKNGIIKDIVTHNAGMEAYCKHKSFNQSLQIFVKFINVASSTKWKSQHLLFFNTALMCWELQYANTNAAIIETRFNLLVPSIYKPQLSDQRKIDLHNLPSFIAKYGVKQHLCHLKTNESLTIITGIGKHSLNDPKLTQMVQQLLVEFNKTHDLQFSTIQGVLCCVCLCFIICKKHIIYK